MNIAQSMRLAALCAPVALAACVTASSTGYPPARTVDVVDDYHGTLVPDPYRWLEELQSEETVAWAAAQAALFEAHVAGDPVREHVLRRLRSIFDGAGSLPSDHRVIRAGGREFHRDEWGEAGRPVYVRTAAGEPLQVLVDPAAISPQAVLGAFRPSPDGQFLAYTISEGGSNWEQLRIRDVATGVDLPEVLHDLVFASFAWTPDGRGLIYSRYGRRAGDVADVRDPAVFHHRLGESQERDELIFSTPAGTIDRLLFVAVPGDGSRLFIYEGSGSGQGALGMALTRVHHLEVARLSAPDAAQHIATLNAEQDAAYSVVDTDGPVAYVFTTKDAPRHRLVAIDLRDPSPSRWREIIPEADGVLQSVHPVGGRWVAHYLENVSSVLRVHSRDGAPIGRIELPTIGTVEQIGGEPTHGEFTFLFHSFAYPDVLLRHDLETGSTVALGGWDAALDTASIDTRQLWFTARDGTPVPMFVVHRRGISLDGAHATMLSGYGSSGTSSIPAFSPRVLAWVELGGVYAIANIRGGGEFGQAWYEAAILDRKQTTFDDFIAAAEYLIANGYTRPERLAIRGGSYGGLLVGAVTTQRPDLFAVAIAEVPVLDMLRFEAGRHEAQYGTPRDPAQFRTLHAYSPLHRVTPGRCYPATLLTTALNDDSAPAWHALKFAASLQAAQDCRRPALVRVAATGGHSGALGLDAQLEVMADAWAFAAKHIGLRLPAATSR
jgi:prolyl oligopeptidase